MDAANPREDSRGSADQYPSKSNTREELDFLVAEAKRGSISALHRLIEEVMVQLANELSARERRMGTGGSCGSSDLLQETTVRMRERFEQFDRHTFEEFKRWARAIRYNLGRQRARNRHSRMSERHLHQIWSELAARHERDPHSAPASMQLERDEELQSIQSLFDALPAHDRFLITLRLFHGMPFKAVARIARSTEDAVNKAYHRALLKLARQVRGR